MKKLFTALVFALLPLITHAEGVTIERINAYITYIDGAEEGAEFQFEDIETWLFAKYVKLSKMDLDKTAKILAKHNFMKKMLFRNMAPYENNDALIHANMRMYLENALGEIEMLNSNLSLKEKFLLELFFIKIDTALKSALQDRYTELKYAPFIYLSKNIHLMMYQSYTFGKKISAIFRALGIFMKGGTNYRQYTKNGVFDKKLLKGVRNSEKILGAEWQLTLCSPKDGYMERDVKSNNLCIYFKAAPYRLVLYAETVGDNGDAHSGDAMAGINNTIKYSADEGASILLPRIPPNMGKGEYFILLY